MATIRNKFHELGNWHNKISMGSIVTKETLSDPSIAKLPPEELKEILGKAVKTLSKFEEYIDGADKVINEIKPFVYERIGGDTEILPNAKQGGNFS